MRSRSLLFQLTGIIGNILEHYDSALFALLAPFIAPLFFEGTDPVTALMLTYGMLPIGLLGRPLGSLFFGWMGDRLGRRRALFYSLLGMALVTVLMGLLPTYRQVGESAPVLLALCRLLQTFFAAGESSGAAIFILENTGPKKRGLLSGIYDASSIGGILLASSLVTWFSYQEAVEEMWRVLFLWGGVTAVFALFIRFNTEESQEFIQSPGLLQGLAESRSALLAIIFASGFSYTTYAFAFTLMNGYIPLVTAITKPEVMQVNTLLLVFDMLLLPCFGFLTNRLKKERVMLFGAWGMVISALPLFYALEGASLGVVIGIRMVILFFGVAFAAPYHAWAMEQVLPQYRYSVLSLGQSLGSQLIGAPTAMICLWLYQQIGGSMTPGFYLMFAAVGAIYALRQRQLKIAPAKLV